MSGLPAELVGTQWDSPLEAPLVGSGWWPLLVEAHERLSAIDPEYRIQQVKEKFGLLRIYAATSASGPAGTDTVRTIQKICTELMMRPGKICGECGSTTAVTTEPRPGGFWELTLCADCRRRMP